MGAPEPWCFALELNWATWTDEVSNLLNNLISRVNFALQLALTVYAELILPFNYHCSHSPNKFRRSSEMIGRRGLTKQAIYKINLILRVNFKLLLALTVYSELILRRKLMNGTKWSFEANGVYVQVLEYCRKANEFQSQF